MKRAIMVDMCDNVATALGDLLSGEPVRIDRGNSAALTIEALEAIPRGFKLATKDIDAGQPVIKYGEVIGLATEPILKGACHEKITRFSHSPGFNSSFSNFGFSKGVATAVI